MGGSASTRRVTFEADENDNITVVKGIRLSENVIGRMRDPTSPAAKPQSVLPKQPASPDSSSPAMSAVNEEELKRKITEELELERARRNLELHQRLQSDKKYIQEEIGKALEREKAASNDQFAKALLRERTSGEEDRLKAKSFARLLEEKEKELKRKDAYCKEQLNRLEERSAELYKLNTEQYQKAVTEVEAKFSRYKVHPVCTNLQDRILQCYQENPKQVLNCSALAKEYIQCVNSAKQSMLRKGG
ncbi:MICOS complex subunit MIC19 [Protopterus annectens]|uniref:MICOS complex subunit MIC19 n=1 Tax=Protopterus annectens TaxID=7888 RepID=UPI001CFAC2F0|nr:MICOS complex subunit MIC19 [Protopterus annectens]